MTTIQITDSTQQTLKQLKKNLNLLTYEDVIQWMLKKTLKQKKSMYGALGTKSMDEVLEGLRDEEDRI
jgi:predicted CopG family antitoxin